MGYTVFPEEIDAHPSSGELHPDVPLSQLEEFTGFTLPKFLPNVSRGDGDCWETRVDLDSRTIRGLAEELRSMKVKCCGKAHENPERDDVDVEAQVSTNVEFSKCEIRHLTRNLVCGHPGLMGKVFLTCTYVLAHLKMIDDDTVARWEQETYEIMEILKQLDAEGTGYRNYPGPGNKKKRLELKKSLQTKEAGVGKRSVELRDEMLGHLDALLAEQGALPKESQGTTEEGHEWQRIEDSLRRYRFETGKLVIDVRLPDQIDSVANALVLTARKLGVEVSNVLSGRRSSEVVTLMEYNLNGKASFEIQDVYLSQTS